MTGRKLVGWWLVCIIAVSAAGCVKTWPDSQPWQAAVTPRPATQTARPNSPQSTPTPTYPAYLATRDPSLPIYTPTPDAPHPLPTLRAHEDQYTIQRGDSLGTIAQRYGVTLNAIIQANSILNPDLVEVGKILTIPAQEPLPPGPDFKIIPDSELVNSPAVINFDIAKFVDQTNGYLATYREEVNEDSLSGAEVVNQVAIEYSVNPRLLLAVLEYQSHWVTQPQPGTDNVDYPIGFNYPSYKGLYRQLSWAANNLNRGYYLWKAGGISALILADGTMLPPAETLNAGTVAV